MAVSGGSTAAGEGSWWRAVLAGDERAANRGPGQTRILVVMTPEIDAFITALHSGETGPVAEATCRYNASVVRARLGITRRLRWPSRVMACGFG